MDYMYFEEHIFSVLYGYLVLMSLAGYFAWEYEKQYWVENGS